MDGLEGLGDSILGDYGGLLQRRQELDEEKKESLCKSLYIVDLLWILCNLLKSNKEVKLSLRDHLCWCCVRVVTPAERGLLSQRVSATCSPCRCIQELHRGLRDLGARSLRPATTCAHSRRLSRRIFEGLRGGVALCDAAHFRPSCLISREG